MIAAVVLAAGAGTRMKSSITKVLHELCGKPLIYHVVSSVRSSGVDRVVVVIGEQADRVEEYLNDEFGEDIETVLQPVRDGTGGAVRVALESIGDDVEYILVCCGDTPLISSETLEEFIKESKKSRVDCALISMELEDPAGYGRIVRDRDGYVKAIVEETDLNQKQRDIKEVNTGVWCLKRDTLLEFTKVMQKNPAKGEYYLTDIVEFCNKRGIKVVGLQAPDSLEFIGINDRLNLSIAWQTLNLALLEGLMSSGVTVIDPYSTYVDVSVRVGRDTVVWPGTVIRGETEVGEGVFIGPNVFIKDSRIEDGSKIEAFSHIDGAVLKENSTAGPFARIRPGSVLERGSRVGNFVELKKTTLGENSKANHLSYVGDSLVGSGVNIGAGTITCNYDGFEKHRTVIEDGVFIGSNSCLVAPVRLGKDSLIAAGSVITRDVPRDSLAFGRARQATKEGLGMGYRRKKRKKE